MFFKYMFEGIEIVSTLECIKDVIADSVISPITPTTSTRTPPPPLLPLTS